MGIFQVNVRCAYWRCKETAQKNSLYCMKHGPDIGGAGLKRSRRSKAPDSSIDDMIRQKPARRPEGIILADE